MLNKNFVKENIKGVQEILARIASFKEHTINEIVGDFHLYGSLRYSFLELIERAIDVNQHLIKERDGEVPGDYAETFRTLAKMSILDANFSEIIAKSVGMRNVIVHEYDEVDDQLLYNSIDLALEQYPQYCQAVLKFLEIN